MEAFQRAAQKCVRPVWLEDLTTFYEGRIARQFVLHFNITDYVIDLSERLELERDGYGYIRDGEVVAESEIPQTMREYLYRFLFDTLSCQTIYTYSLANGLTAVDAGTQDEGHELTVEREAHGPGMQRIYDLYKSTRGGEQQTRGVVQRENSTRLPTDMSECLKLLGHVLRQKHLDSAAVEREHPLAVILDYVEKLIPFHLGEGQGDREQLQALEVVQRWALDPLIRKTFNLIILLTTNIGQIPQGVYAEGSGCRAIRIPLPDETERAAFIRFKMNRARPRLVPLSGSDFGINDAEQAQRLARATQGMRLSDIDNLSRRVAAEAIKRNRDTLQQANIMPLLQMEDVQRAKAEAIQAQSADLLEIVRPTRGFNEIGGLDALKQYLWKRTRFMLKNEYSPIVPSGLLLAGPPGTGKTIIAEALATESGFNLVKMRNIQDKWVGSSERNLELVLNLLKDLHPVIVFIDEIDQAMVRRDTGQGGDSGVGARMFARLLEEMSNATNRGRILWVAATNRADMLDEALLRRFDRVVPLLVPDLNESCRIFATIVEVIIKQSGGRIQVAYGVDLAQSGREDKLGFPNPTQDDLDKFLPVAKITSEIGLTGASIEIVVRRAIEMVYEEMVDAAGKRGVEIMPLVPLIESRHLLKAVNDYKPNYQRDVYDYQSLLAIRACNFYSVIPTLPKGGVYERIQKADGTIDIERLEEELHLIELRRRVERVSL